MEKIEVYSKEKCVQCTATKRSLGSAGIAYTEFMLEDMPEKAEEFRSKGLMQAPVVVTETETWTGFNPIKIGELSRRIKGS